MKARVKATGEIGIVVNMALLLGNRGYRYQSDEVEIIDSYANIETSKDPDYWEKLKHQYAGMAMNALLLTNNIRNGDLEGMRECNTNAMAIAHALIEKLKSESNDKERTA